MAKGKAYGVGVGPGDPKLMTLRAVELIKENDAHAFIMVSETKSYVGGYFGK